VPLDPQLRALLHTVITLVPSAATVNVYGEVGVGTAATVFARLQPHVREVEKMDGTFDRTDTMIFLDGAVTTTPTFDCQVFTGSSTSPAFARKLKSIHPVYDEIGRIDHWELLL